MVKMTKISNLNENRSISWSQNLITYLGCTAFYDSIYKHSYSSMFSWMGFTASDRTDNFVEWQKIQKCQ